MQLPIHARQPYTGDIQQIEFNTELNHKKITQNTFLFLRALHSTQLSYECYIFMFKSGKYGKSLTGWSNMDSSKISLRILEF